MNHHLNGDSYDGFLKDDQRNGTSKIVNKNSNKYHDEWKYDIRNGKGIFYFNDGSFKNNGIFTKN